MRFSEIICRFLFWGAFVLIVPVAFIWLVSPAHFATDRVDQFHHVADRVTAISLGSSHSRAIHFPSLGYNGHSFADDRGDIRTAVTKARYLLPYTPDLKYVLMPVSPGYLAFDRKEAFGGTDPDLNAAFANAPWPTDFRNLPLGEQLQMVRSHIVTLETFETANRLARETIKSSIFRLMGKNREMLRNPCRARTNPADFPDEFGLRNGYTRDPLPTRCLPVSAAADAAFHASQINAILKRDKNIRAENTNLLLDLAGRLAERKIELILFTPPFPDAYYGSERLGALSDDDKPYIKKLTERPNVRLLDFHDLFSASGDAGANRFFSDGNHLTLSGAQSFSKALGKSMRDNTDPVSTSMAGADAEFLRE
ncbi:MAG: SGNH/GDSL hydrolase family protein [Hyphomicrobiales bacterium]|nr:SGNH/GDSL hydrolase family protein [Hyphomicrobiales bacterium]